MIIFINTFIKMHFISHRGNINGPNTDRENHPGYIDEAIQKGFDVEVDVWFENDKLFLGHDKPQYEIELSFLILRKSVLWCHAKNLEAFNILLSNDLHCFSHDKDDAVLTSHNFVWTYPGRKHVKNSIAVIPEKVDNKIRDVSNIVGICSDYIYDWMVVF